jgi:four helix bundle protein
MSFADDMQTRLHEFAMAAVRFARTLPESSEGREWSCQLRRASTGASAAYRASRRGKSKRDWLDKIADCVEELDECDNWFSVIEDSKLMPVPQDLRSEANAVRAILAKSLATGRDNERRRKERFTARRKSDPE